MGCDIHSYAQKYVDGGWENIPGVYPFDWRSYRVYGFLADVRNYSEIPPISQPRGFPEEILSSYDDEDCPFCCYHSASWLSLQELLDFDYEQVIEDRRVTIDNDGGRTCPPGQGKKMTYREFLLEGFFDELNRLKEIGVERIVFYFDS